MKRYERVADKDLAGWVYFFTDPSIKKMPEDAEKRAIDAICMVMDDRQQTIFLQRYRDHATLGGIAKQMGLSRPRIHSILETAAERLWDSETASVILRDGIEAGRRFQKVNMEESIYFFPQDIMKGLQGDPLKVIELAQKNSRKNITTRLSREIGALSVGEVAVFTRKRMNSMCGVGEKSKEYLKEMFRAYLEEKNGGKENE